MRTTRLVSVLAAVGGLALTAAACDRTPTAMSGEDARASTAVDHGHISGGVSVTWNADNRSRGDIDLTAHEGGAVSSDRGTFEWEAYDDASNLVREMTITVRAVDVTGSEARFLGEVTHDSWGDLTGYWYAFYAKDGGSPGPGNDAIRWTNSSSKSGLPGGGDLNYDMNDLPDRFTIVDGNLTAND